MFISNTGTLTVQGIPWAYTKHNDKLAFGYGKHAIHFVPQTGYYHLKEAGETIFAATTVAGCLDNATPFVLDYHASLIVPSWEETN
jgi:hypothetical protein